MKQMRAILCGVLAVLMLAGCGGVEQVVCRSERPDPAVDLTQYAVREAAYPVYPKQPRLEDYTDETAWAETGTPISRTLKSGRRRCGRWA